MLRRAATVLRGRHAAWLLRLPRRPVTTAPALLGRHLKAQPSSGWAPPQTHPGGSAGARGFARMARRIAPARPDGYSTSEGEADVREREEVEDLERGAGGEEGAEGEDADGSEWEGFMLDLGAGADGDEEEEEDSAEGRQKQ